MKIAPAVLAALAACAGAQAQTNDHYFRSWRWTEEAMAPRAMGLAGAMTAGAEDVSAAAHNPAGLAGLTQSEASASLLSRRAGEGLLGDALVSRTGIGFAGLAGRVGSRLVLAGTLSETQARRVRLNAALELPDGVPETGELEAVVTELGLAVAWRLTPGVHLGARITGARLALDGEYDREPPSGPVELRVASTADVTAVGGAFGLVVQPARRVKLGLSAAPGRHWRVTRTAVSPLLGSVLDAGSGFDLRQPSVVSAGVSVEASLKLRLTAQVDRVGYGEIQSALVIGQGARRREEYALEDAWEPRVAVELSLPRRAFSFQLRGGLHWQATGTLRFQGADPLETATFVGDERSLVGAAGLSLVTTRWLRIDVAAQFAHERNAFAAGLAGRF
jgi:long-subunit fatty acid transport protein